MYFTYKLPVIFFKTNVRLPRFKAFPTIDCTTTNFASINLNNNYENNSHYFKFIKAKISNTVEFYNWIEIDYFKPNIFQIFNISNYKK